MSGPRRLMIMAGEVSGDMHAAGLVRAIRTRTPDVSCFGIGGDALRAAGVEIVRDIREMAVLGLAEVLPKLAFFRRVFREMVSLLAERKPDAVILVDYPEFNLRFAARAHAMGIKVIYYVCPQVWAWRPSRIAGMSRVIDRLLVIFPFEPEVFKGTGLKVDYVGHPLIEEARHSLAEPLTDLPWRGEPRIAILPGSRRQEIARILPAFWKACGLIEKQYPDASFIVASPSDEIAAEALECVKRLTDGLQRWSVVSGQTRQVLRQARAALVASGTATLETALMGCPMVIAYKLAPLSFFLLKRLVTLKHIGIVNIIAGRTLCPELIQNAAAPSALADALQPLLNDTPERRQMIEGLAEVARSLGDGGAHDRAAAIVLEELKLIASPTSNVLYSPPEG